MKDFKVGRIEGFANNELKLLSLLDRVRDEDTLILNGDIFELKQFKLQEIYDVYSNILNSLIKFNVFYIVGNHDFKLLSRPSMVLINFIPQPYVIIEDILFLHGHQYDWLNNRSHWMINWALQSLRWMEEQINPHIDIDLDRLLKFGSASDNTQKYVDCAIKEAKRCKVKYVVLGHIHIITMAKDNGIYYLNSGCWVNGRSDYLEFTLDDDRKIYCISDLHLGNKGKADDFWS